MIWYLLLLGMLYLMCGSSVLIVIVMMLMEFDYYCLMIFEFYTILFFMIITNIGSSFERGLANSYLLFFSFVLGFVVINNGLTQMGLLLVVLSLAKLPMYGLHSWLPNVHVEASILMSIVLAGAVLKLGILYVWNFSHVIIVGSLLFISCWMLLSVVDSKSFAAYSSVLHMSLCVVFCIILILLVSYIHIVLSPLIFMTIYKVYVISGSRFYSNVGFIMIVLWIINFGLPFLGSFFSEVYIMQYLSIILLVLVMMYLIIGYVMMNSLNSDSKGVFYLPLLSLYMLVV